ncbi:protease modulator HflC [Marispirochaeta sp.]|jgi:modulator of FtsH protease HflC|uniref:protease modulator HflC n=1 Tax=Marispirochaeta sp. TaxID=2038653 RepID=UPI0029C6F9DB|nr:protease modulator HflC [Marispirochaeta sp.]
MKRLATVLIVVAVLLVVFVALGPFYILFEGEQAVVTRFGAIVSTSRDAGLKFKMPVIDTVTKYPKKILSWDGDAQRLPTAENQFIWVDATARWKIIDPTLFYESVTSVNQAFARLDEVIDSSIRTVIADNPLFEAVRNSNVINEIERSDVVRIAADTDEVQAEDIAAEETPAIIDTSKTYPEVAKGRNKLSEEMFEAARKVTPQYGIELIDIIIRQIRYSDDLTESVYNRMIAERNQKAQEFRSRGEGQKAFWLGKLDNEKRTILSRAYTEAETLKGNADREAAGIYADAYSADEEFAIFWRSLESYRNTMSKFNKTLTTDMEYFRYLYDQDG